MATFIYRVTLDDGEVIAIREALTISSVTA